MVIVVDHDEVSQLEMAGSTGGLTRNTFHRTTVTEEAECVVVDQLKAGFIEFGGSMSLRNCETNGVRETLSKRTGGDFNAWCVLRFRMSGGDTINLLIVDTSRQQLKRIRELLEGEHTRKAFKSSSDTP